MTLVAGIWVQMTRRGFPFIPTFLVVVALRASKWLFGLYVLSCVVGVFWKELCFPTCILEGRLFRRMWNFKFCNTGEFYCAVMRRELQVLCCGLHDFAGEPEFFAFPAFAVRFL
ncbi:uncharacterized protein [Coffea arabica]|uniref:Uncharacterized protein isoform X4 n=1 Tax=Coffea arabica TaxID=13443 RepID=A0ABM4X415_COFAR